MAEDLVTPEEPVEQEKIRRQVEMEIIKLGSYYGTANVAQRQNIGAALTLLVAALLVDSDTRASTLLNLGRKNARLAVMPKMRSVAPEKYLRFTK